MSSVPVHAVLWGGGKRGFSGMRPFQLCTRAPLHPFLAAALKRGTAVFDPETRNRTCPMGQRGQTSSGTAYQGPADDFSRGGDHARRPFPNFFFLNIHEIYDILPHCLIWIVVLTPSPSPWLIYFATQLHFHATVFSVLSHTDPRRIFFSVDEETWYIYIS